jgi:hypothetical protein
MNMYNPYAPNPYIQQGQQQDIGGLAPVFQNIGAQQANLNQAMAQNQGLTQQAGQTAGGGMNPMAMAAMLRKGQSSNPYTNAQAAMQQYGAENVYGYGGQGQVPTQITGQDVYEPVKNMPVAGAYGQLLPNN